MVSLPRSLAVDSVVHGELQYVRLLAAIAEPVDSGTVVLVEPNLRYKLKGTPDRVFTTSPEVLEGLAGAVQANPSFRAEFDSEMGDVFSHPRERHLREFANEYARSIGDGLAGCVEFDLDLYLANPLLVDALTRIDTQKPNRVEVLELLSLPMPNLDKLPVGDILALREDDVAFREWQIVMSEVIEAAGKRLSRDPEAGTQDLLAEVEARVGPAQERIEARIDGSSLLGPVTAGQLHHF